MNNRWTVPALAEEASARQMIVPDYYEVLELDVASQIDIVYEAAVADLAKD